MIPMYGVEAHGGRIVSLDDEAVVKDLTNSAGVGGNAYVPYIISAPFDGGVGGWSTLRRAVQHVHADGAVTVDVTPYKDEQETDQTISRDLAIGDNFIVDAPLKVGGTTFAVKVELSDFDAAAELGKADQYFVARRRRRGTP